MAVGIKSNPQGLPEDLRGPQKGNFGQKWGPRSAVEVTEGAKAHDIESGSQISVFGLALTTGDPNDRKKDYGKGKDDKYTICTLEIHTHFAYGKKF